MKINFYAKNVKLTDVCIRTKALVHPPSEYGVIYSGEGRKRVCFMCFDMQLVNALLLQVTYVPFADRRYFISGQVTFTKGHTFLAIEKIEFPVGRSILEKDQLEKNAREAVEEEFAIGKQLASLF
jgi:hypothetical protein